MGQFALMSAELLPSEANGLGIASALDVEDALLDLVGSLGMLRCSESPPSVYCLLRPSSTGQPKKHINSSEYR